MMTERHTEALFTLAGIEATKFHKLANQYWGDGAYAELAAQSPWWLVQTPHGFIKLGWRKRVISIDWSDTPHRGEVTSDNVTKSAVMVHAWSYAKAVEYLTQLGVQLRRMLVNAEPQGAHP
jgi:hypothetical protein